MMLASLAVMSDCVALVVMMLASLAVMSDCVALSYTGAIIS